MAVSYNIAAPASVLFIVIYISVFILSTVGNTCVLVTFSLPRMVRQKLGINLTIQQEQENEMYT